MSEWPPPARLALRSICASGAGVAILCLAKLSESHDSFASTSDVRSNLRLMLIFIPLLASLAVSLTAEHRFKKGVEQQVWRREDLDRLYNKLGPASWVAFALTVVSALYMLIHQRQQLDIFFWLYMLLVPIQSVGRLRMAVRPPRPVATPVKWEEFKPIHSDTWGQPRHD